MHDPLSDALDAMTARQVEELMVRAGKRLQRCVVCGSDGGEPMRVLRGNTRASMMLCPACFENNRLPEGRSEP